MFTAEYDPKALTVGLTLNGERWDQAIHDFAEGQRVVNYASGAASVSIDAASGAVYVGIDWSHAASVDWSAVAQDYANGKGREISMYFPSD